MESGPYLSPSVADHPLKTATDHCLGRPLPHQQANQPQDPLKASFLFYSSVYVVLATVSSRYPTP